MTNRITGLNSGLDTESIITALTQTYQDRVDKNTSAQTKLSWKQNAWKSTNKNIVSFYNGKLADMRFSTAYNKKTSTSSSSAVSVITGDSAMLSTSTVSSTSLAKASYLTGNKVYTTDGNLASSDTTMSELGITEDTTISFNMGGTTDGSDVLSITISADDTMSSIASKISSATSTSGLSLAANYDETQGRFYIASTNTGEDYGFTVDTSTGADALSLLGINTDELDDSSQYQEAADAELVMNGVTYTSSSNAFEINGLTITINSSTDDEFTITTSNDTSGVYDMVKEYLSEYNSLIKKLDTLYNADSASKYDILTADQKEEMTEDEITEWNSKIKSGLLSKDNTLYSVISALKQTMASGFSVTDSDGNTSTWYLSTLGINTKGYFEAEENERGAYHIDGDGDDEYSASKTDKLATAIANDPDAITSFFTQLSKQVYTQLGNLMKGTTYSSAYTVYEDKLMASQYSDYTTAISDAEDDLEAKQDYYYSKFAAMEKALSKINSSSSSLSSMLGS